MASVKVPSASRVGTDPMYRRTVVALALLATVVLAGADEGRQAQLMRLMHDHSPATQDELLALLGAKNEPAPVVAAVAPSSKPGGRRLLACSTTSCTQFTSFVTCFLGNYCREPYWGACIFPGGSTRPSWLFQSGCCGCRK
ncbi:hypothetical protein ABPG75_006486 [Micractinium tetrahymenae]